MPQLVVAGATLMCSFGAMPSTLQVLPTNRVTATSKPVATILDHKPLVNIASFGVCSSMANPSVAAATAAAMGVLTPQPCLPVTTSPWTPGSPPVTIGNCPALNATSTCMCAWMGVITISFPGQVTVNVK